MPASDLHFHEIPFQTSDHRVTFDPLRSSLKFAVLCYHSVLRAAAVLIPFSVCGKRCLGYDIQNDERAAKL
jgi:hypothetical protein